MGVFEKYRIEPSFYPVLRLEKLEQVVGVARKGSEIIYWEDVEEGFEVSSIGADGRILEYGSNQDTLGLALNHWLDGRNRVPECGSR